MKSKTVCFSKKQVYASTIGLLILTGLFIYLWTVVSKNKKDGMANVNLYSHLDSDSSQQKLKMLENQLFEANLNEQRCKTELYETKKLLKNSGLGESALLNKIYNPLVSPNRYYPGGRLNEPSVLTYDDYQQIGFIYKDNERYPLFGRHKYQGRTDRWEYYVIDESRNRLKIPFLSKNDEELYNNDTISINGLGNDFNIQIYDYETFRYNPNL